MKKFTLTALVSIIVSAQAWVSVANAQNLYSVDSILMQIQEVDFRITELQDTTIERRDFVANARMDFEDERAEANSGFLARWNGPMETRNFDKFVFWEAEQERVRMNRSKALYKERNKLVDQLVTIASEIVVVRVKVSGIDLQLHFHHALIRQSESALIRARARFTSRAAQVNGTFWNRWDGQYAVYDFRRESPHYQNPTEIKKTQYAIEELNVERTNLVFAAASADECSTTLTYGRSR